MPTSSPGGSELDSALRAALEAELTAKYGPLLSGNSLREVLAFQTPAAFRRSASRRQLPVPVFTIAHRRGKFALAKDVAAWLASRRASATTPGAAVLTTEDAQ